MNDVIFLHSFTLLLLLLLIAQVWYNFNEKVLTV